MEDEEIGTCDTCGTEYNTWSREGRCGDCGECSYHCTHEEGEVLRTKPDSVADFVEQLFDLSLQMRNAGQDGWAVEVRAIANCLAEGLELDKQ